VLHDREETAERGEKGSMIREKNRRRKRRMRKKTSALEKVEGKERPI